jgi:hypothetical protein
MTLDRYADLFDDDLDDVADRLDACGRHRADGSRTGPAQRRADQPHAAEESQVKRPVEGVETRGIEPLTPALQRRCSAN